MIFACCSLGGWTAVLIRARFFPALYAPFAALCLVVLTLVAGGMLALFEQTRFVILALGLVGGAVSLVPWCHRRMAVPLVFVALLLFLTWYYTGVRVAFWDEYFWAGFSKALQFENGFWKWGTPLPRQDSVLLYPPLLTALHGLFMPAGTLSETGIALGGNAFVVALGFVFFRTAHRRWPFFPALALALCCVTLVSIMNAELKGSWWTGQCWYPVALADKTQAALFTACACFTLLEPVRPLRRRMLLLGLPMLALCKATGLVLAVCVLACLAVRQWRGAFSCQSCLNAALSVLPLLLVTLLPWAAWKIYCQIFIPLPLEALPGRPLLPPDTDALLSLLTAFGKAYVLQGCISLPYVGPLHVLTSAVTLSLLVLGVLPLYLRWSRTRLPISFWRAGMVLGLGLLGWTAIHLLAAYLWFASSDNAQGFSAARYSAVYVSCLCALALLFLSQLKRHSGGHSGGHSGQRPPLAVPVYVFLALVGLSLVLPWQRPAVASAQRPALAEMEKAAALLTQHTAAGATYWLVMQNTKGEEISALRYLTMPWRTMPPASTRMAFSVPDAPEVILAAGELPADLRALAQRFGTDYLLLWQYDTDFAQKYAAMLGLGSLKAPVLLDLRQWRAGEKDMPTPVEGLASFSEGGGP